MTSFNRGLFDDWIVALRSGKYKQGRLTLMSDGRYCCMGVLCDTLPDERQHLVNFDQSFPSIENIPELSFLNSSSYSWLSDDEKSNTAILPVLKAFLAQENDLNHKSFNEIADWLESHVDNYIKSIGESKMMKLTIGDNVFGTQIEVPYLSKYGKDRIVVTLNEDGINVAATGTLNANGVQALRDAINIAESLQRVEELKDND